MRFYLSLMIFPLLLSCISEKNYNSESFQSKTLKKSLQLLKFKQSILDNLKNNKQFVDKDNEQSTPPGYILKKYEVETIYIQDRAVYIINPIKSESNKTVLYLHGGAFMANTLPIHWNFLDKIISNTNVTVILPDYPLAPEENWSDAFNFMEGLQIQLLNNITDMIFMGDSAGAGLALSWSMLLRNREERLPEKLILLSPWLDLGMSNNKIPEMEETDPYLSREALTIAGRYWANGLNITDWRISPIYGNYNNLPTIYIFTGTSDILNPDARLLYNNVRSIEFYEYNDMIHDWMFFRMPESQQCIIQLTTILNTEN